ncbi:hypothetical protein BCEN4_2530002 [Burkholderia cenocepacia]|nr:hypothetical protein BCEN4_2530002 [Burkholderia cenocepacia]
MPGPTLLPDAPAMPAVEAAGVSKGATH